MFKHLPNLKLLKTFESAARLKSYSLAATELCISQAAVSQQMRQLEDSLATPLFYRQDKQMLLTKNGNAFYATTLKALTLLENSIAQLKENELAGSLTITSTVAFTNLWLMPRLASFAKLYPEIQINVVPSAHFEDLKQSSIDLAIRFGQSVEKHTPTNYHCEFFGEDKVLPVCSSELQQQHQFTSANDFLKTWLVSLDNPGPFNWPEWFESINCKDYQSHDKWTYVPSTDMAINAVLNNHGITLAAEYLYKQLIAKNALCVPINIAHPNTVKRYFVYSKSFEHSKRLQVFKDWLIKEMAI